MTDKQKKFGRIANLFENLSTTSLHLNKAENGRSNSPSLMRARSPLSRSFSSNAFDAFDAFESPRADQRTLFSTPTYSSLNSPQDNELEFDTKSSLRSFGSASTATVKPINEIRQSRVFTMPNVTPTPSPSPMAGVSVFPNIDAVRPYSVEEVEALFGPLGPAPPIPPRNPGRLLRGKELIERLAEARRMEHTINVLNSQKPDEEDKKRFAEKYGGRRDLSKNEAVQKYLEELEDGSARSDTGHTAESSIEESQEEDQLYQRSAKLETPESIRLNLEHRDNGGVEVFENDSNADTSELSGHVTDHEEHQPAGDDEFGLGISLHDQQEFARPKKLVDIEEEEEFDVESLAPESSALQKPCVTESLTPQPLFCTPPSRITNFNPDDSGKYDYSSFIAAGASPESIIDELLEENYRGQAQDFVRKSSARSIRSITSPAQSTPRSTRSPNPAFIALGLRSASTPEYYTPTRQPSKGDTFASSQRQLPRVLSDGSGIGQVVFEAYKVVNGGDSGTKDSELGQDAVASASPHTTYGHRFSIPGVKSLGLRVSKTRPGPEISTRGFYYFTEEEREGITALVLENFRQCSHHENCTECLQLEYAYYENKAMPTSIPPEERQKIINNNRSLRNIKNELENLAEHGAISDDAYDTIMRSLPAESSLNGTRSQAPAPSPVPSAALNNLSLNNSDAPPPAYNNPAPPALPGRKEAAPPAKPELARAIALYRYTEAGDCNFEVGDQIAVYEFMNNEWWLGKNFRTNQEGVFPVNYVQRQANPSPHTGNYGNEKAGGYPGMARQSQGPPPPGPSNPYNSAVPPMAVAEQPSEGKSGKGGEMGKKFGKKLGNAAIFGAGATIGGNIVNSIF